ncbi:DUF3558 domain-containing protein [Streptomyces sp. Li-HN-5-11]|uniref:DUF3558 family protein n=1 Tax=Streptomyces sp. Li-HN-5-11 TaxID=3075432 RepID=UPI0028B1D3C8|nr:DUF3558 family protein [Streptomyces sp. Li-HN-5-11]WNM29401.1 DUF3558 domain-containing protein [Streptomyces sp. Li-HN-5-11]
MSEGTMQRAAQREQSDPRAKRVNRVLVGAAAVPVMLLAAACSSGSGSSDGAKESPAADVKGSASGSASPTVQAAAYGKLPQPCKVLSDKTLGELVPKGLKSAKQNSLSDGSSRGGCSWNSLQDNGVKGSQFRWLNVSMLRFASDAGRGSGESQAKAFFKQQVQRALEATGDNGLKAQPVAGTGDEASLVRWQEKRKEGVFKEQKVVARVENVVVTLDYNGAGLAGDKTPDADDLSKAAEQAAKEAVAAVAAANGDGGGAGGASSGSPSGSASPSKSASPSASASKAGKSGASASPSSSASTAAAKG